MERIEMSRVRALGSFMPTEEHALMGEIGRLKVYSLYDEPLVEVEVVTPDCERVATLSLSHTDLPHVYTVAEMTVDSNNQGFGLAPRLYEFLISKGLCLGAGEEQSAGGRRIWYNLHRRGRVSLLARLSPREEFYEVDRDDDEQEIWVDGFDLYGDGGEVYAYQL